MRNDRNASDLAGETQQVAKMVVLTRIKVDDISKIFDSVWRWLLLRFSVIAHTFNRVEFWHYATWQRSATPPSDLGVCALRLALSVLPQWQCLQMSEFRLWAALDRLWLLLWYLYLQFCRQEVDTNRMQWDLSHYKMEYNLGSSLFKVKEYTTPGCQLPHLWGRVYVHNEIFMYKYLYLFHRE